MILIKTEVIKAYLKAIGRNQEWLAKKMDITPGYLSLMINNYCKVSREMMECFMDLTHSDFEHLFERRMLEDDRQFFGDRIYFQGCLMKRKEYRKIILNREMLEIIKKNIDSEIKL